MDRQSERDIRQDNVYLGCSIKLVSIEEINNVVKDRQKDRQRDNEVYRYTERQTHR